MSPVSSYLNSYDESETFLLSVRLSLLAYTKLPKTYTTADLEFKLHFSFTLKMGIIHKICALKFSVHM